MINFACPNVKVLLEEKKKHGIDSDTLGITYSTIEAYLPSKKKKKSSSERRKENDTRYKGKTEDLSLQ